MTAVALQSGVDAGTLTILLLPLCYCCRARWWHVAHRWRPRWCTRRSTMAAWSTRRRWRRCCHWRSRADTAWTIRGKVRLDLCRLRWLADVGESTWVDRWPGLGCRGAGCRIWGRNPIHMSTRLSRWSTGRHRGRVLRLSRKGRRWQRRSAGWWCSEVSTAPIAPRAILRTRRRLGWRIQSTIGGLC